jgi:oxygen-independent coproporphyrinogen-3 oxidase
MPNKPQALYIHIPFCDHICSYCDFPKYLSSRQKEESYLSALKKELNGIDETDLNTVYIGGGTPSALEPPLLTDLLSFINSKFKIHEEFTLEGNPESLSEEKAQILFNYGVNRVSLGVQSLSGEVLKDLGRLPESQKLAEEAIANLHRAGIFNLNVDFIYGMEKEKDADLQKDVNWALEQKVTHVSAYSIQIEKGTKLYSQPGLTKEEDGLADDYALLVESLEKAGFQRYEVSNFAKPGFESKHNLTYWHNEEYYAAGLGAVSYVKGLRATRTRNLNKYLAGQEIIDNCQQDDLADREFNYLMLNLRLTEGFSLADFQEKFHKDFMKSYQKELLMAQDRLKIENGRVKVKKDSLYVLDAILVDLLHFKEEKNS